MLFIMMSRKFGCSPPWHSKLPVLFTHSYIVSQKCESSPPTYLLPYIIQLILKQVRGRSHEFLLMDGGGRGYPNTAQKASKMEKKEPKILNFEIFGWGRGTASERSNRAARYTVFSTKLTSVPPPF